jgi:hypothetical protein
MRKGLVSLGCLFLDGHYIPYTGKEKVHLNFHTQRNMMQPGQNELYIHDIKGRIVYFDLQEGKGNMLEVIKEQSKAIAPFLQDHPPLFVVDKEIWGVDNFLYLQQHGCRFITWEKNTDASKVNAIEDDLFSEPFEVNNKSYRGYELKKIYKNVNKKSIELRRIVIWNLKTGRRPVAISNDKDEDMQSLAVGMLNRWGKSENSFKHLKSRTSMHYNPTIDISKSSEYQDIKNPEYIKVEKELKTLKNKLAKTERAIGRKPMNKNKDGSLRKNKSREEMIQIQKALHEQIQQVQNKISQLPKRVNVNSVEGKKEFKTIDTEGKMLWDISQAYMWNSRKYLSNMLKEYLPNERDLLPVLEAITKSKGKLKISKEAITVVLEPLERKQFCNAQIQLCRKLNQLHQTINNKQLLFDVQKI